MTKDLKGSKRGKDMKSMSNNINRFAKVDRNGLIMLVHLTKSSNNGNTLKGNVLKFLDWPHWGDKEDTKPIFKTTLVLKKMILEEYEPEVFTKKYPYLLI
jgi:hypothetical protein